MGILIKNTSKNYEDSGKYYSKAFRQIFGGKELITDSTINPPLSGYKVDIAQLYAPNSIQTLDKPFSLAGNIAEITFHGCSANNGEHLFDIIDNVLHRRIIIVGVDTSHFKMYYCNNGSVYMFTATSDVVITLGIISCKLDLENNVIVDNKLVVYSMGIKTEPSVTTTSVTDDPETPANYLDFSSLTYGIRIQGDSEGEIIPNTLTRFKGVRLCIDKKDIACISVVSPSDVFEWVNNSFFVYSGSIHNVSPVTLPIVLIYTYKAFEMYNNDH